MKEEGTGQAKKYVVIVAGGKGLRMGGDLPKQFLPMAGKPVLMHTLETFHRWDASAVLILVLPEDHQPYWAMLCREIGCRVPHEIVSGGDTRFHSVRNGLERVAALQGFASEGEEERGDEEIPEPGRERPEDTEQACQSEGKRQEPFYVAVHDGVRPFVSPGVIHACFHEARQRGAAIPVVPMIDSLRKTEGEESRPVDRSRYFAVQTPQVFEGGLLLRAYTQPYSPLFTDDASVVEAAGGKIRLVEGNRENIKLTTPFDRMVAEALFRRAAEEGKEASFLSDN